MARAAQGGDVAQLERIAAQVREPLRAFLAKRIEPADDAEDLAHETLLRAFEYLDRYDAERSFQTWLFAIGKNLAVNHSVSQGRRSTRHQAAQSVAAVSFEARPELGLWRRAQRLLSDESYRALWLRYREEYEVKEIAQELGRSVVSTKVMLFRARKRLLKEVSEQC